MKLTLAIVVGLIALVAALAYALRLRRVRSEAAPFERPSHAPLNALLGEHVRAGGVDYDALSRDGRLDRYVATLATWGPESAPGDFPTEASRLAYSINAYNALVLFAVKRAWPIGSVHDVRGLLEPKAGFGFFWAQLFRLDGRWINLYDLEHDVLRGGFEDARIHAAIVCASRSCPTLSAEAYLPDTLDAQLDDAMRDFTSNPRHVRVDDATERIALSAIYDWFGEDFEAEARRRGAGESVLDAIAHFADERTRASLRRARAAGYTVVYRDYDWSVNLPHDDGA